jgi:hypothetical protein
LVASALGPSPRGQETPGGCRRTTIRSEGPSPRGRGNLGNLAPESDVRGSIPRRRGSRSGDTIGTKEDGTIPAQAGKPRSSPTAGSSPWVHPRVGEEVGFGPWSVG